MASKTHSDLIVIGAGPGGYVAAIRAAQLGLSVTVVEKRSTLGGTCLNVGCIPSKALLNASEKFEEANLGYLADLGISHGKAKLDLKKMMSSKDEVVKGLTGGIDMLFKKNKITRIIGVAAITKAGEVSVKGKGSTQKITADRILIATGSESSSLPGVDIDEDKIVSSTGALSLSSVPKKLILIGAGYIGLEMGTVWSRLGAKVEVVEYLPRILPGMDSEIASKFKDILEKQGLSFSLGTAVKSAKANKSGVVVDITSGDGKSKKLTADVVIVAVGRRPNTDGLGLENIGVEFDEGRRILVDEDFETNIPGIYAIGDVIPGPMLAHKAEEDGVAAVEIMAGMASHHDISGDHIPGIVYTAPEIATLGKTEDQLKDDGVDFKKGIFPFMANSRARATGHTEGFVKILADSKTDRVLGVHIIGHEAGTLIHECATAMSFGASSEDIARTCHGHPTMNEAVKEAALAVDGRAIHI